MVGECPELGGEAAGTTLQYYVGGAAVTSDESGFGLDAYEPLFFNDQGWWGEQTAFKVTLAIPADASYTKAYYFCHIHAGMSAEIEITGSTAAAPTVLNAATLAGETEASALAIYAAIVAGHQKAVSNFDETCGTYQVFAAASGSNGILMCPSENHLLCGAGSHGTFETCLKKIDCAMHYDMAVSVPSGSSKFATFARQMISHHQNAVSMAKALAKHHTAGDYPAGTEDQDMAWANGLIRGIINVQNSQIQQMQGWLDANAGLAGTSTNCYNGPDLSPPEPPSPPPAPDSPLPPPPMPPWGGYQPVAGGWSFDDGPGRFYSGSGTKPKIICNADACDSLWSMGVREDQLVGYYGASLTATAAAWNGICQSVWCMNVHFEKMKNVESAYHVMDVDLVRSLGATIIVDTVYCGMSGDMSVKDACKTDADKYMPWVQGAGIGTWSNIVDIKLLDLVLIPMNVYQVGMIELVDSFARLAIAVGDAPNPDLMHHCQDMHEAMTELQVVARKMETDGVRVTAAWIGSPPSMIYGLDPTSDPVSIMLEELGVPMTHMNINDVRGGYWEWMSFPSSDKVMRKANPDDTTYTVEGIYPTDVWLYDHRNHATHMEGNAEPHVQFNDPAWVAGQKAAWPIGTTHTYERVTRILTTYIEVFGAAKRIAPKTECMSVQLGQRLGGGNWACHAPAAKFPSCPSGTPGMVSAMISPDNNNTDSSDSNSSDSDRLEGGAVAGLAVGMLVVGCVLGALATFLLGTMNKGKNAGTTTSIQKPDHV